jgi:hypothetical protein
MAKAIPDQVDRSDTRPLAGRRLLCSAKFQWAFDLIGTQKFSLSALHDSKILSESRDLREPFIIHPSPVKRGVRTENLIRCGAGSRIGLSNAW